MPPGIGYPPKRRAAFSTNRSATLSGAQGGGGGGLGGTPVGPGRGPIRNALGNDNFHHTLKDRMAARRADAAIASGPQGAVARGPQGAVAVAPDGGTAPATGNVKRRRVDLAKRMRGAGSGGITPEMRAEGRGLGIADSSFNRVAGNIGANEAFTPGTPVPAAPTPKKRGTSPVGSSTVQSGIKNPWPNSERLLQRSRFLRERSGRLDPNDLLARSRQRRKDRKEAS
jgi:hypothetical protein